MYSSRFKASRRRTDTGSDAEPAVVTNGAPSQPTSTVNKAPSPIDTQTIPTDFEHILDKLPDAVIAKGLRIQGEAKFSRLLRIDGAFEGSLMSDGGSLIVGETGEVTCDISNLQELYVEGRFIGDIVAEKVQLRKGAVVKGNITCCSLGLDPSARFKGSTNITPRAKWSDKSHDDDLDPSSKGFGESNAANADSRGFKRMMPGMSTSTKANGFSHPTKTSGDSSSLPMNIEDDDKSSKNDH